MPKLPIVLPEVKTSLTPEQQQAIFDQLLNGLNQDVQNAMCDIHSIETFGHLLRNASTIKEFLLKHDVNVQLAILNYLKFSHSLNDIIKSSKILDEFGLNSNYFLSAEFEDSQIIDLNYGKLEIAIEYLKNKYRTTSDTERKLIAAENKAIGDIIKDSYQQPGKLLSYLNTMEYTVLTTKNLTVKGIEDTLINVLNFTPLQKQNFDTMVLYQQQFSRDNKNSSSSKNPLADLFEAGFNQNILLAIDNDILKNLLKKSTDIKHYLNNFLDIDKYPQCLKLVALSVDELDTEIQNNSSLAAVYPNYRPIPTNSLGHDISGFLLKERNAPEEKIKKADIEHGICLGASMMWIAANYLKKLPLTSKENVDKATRARDSIAYNQYCHFLLSVWRHYPNMLSPREKDVLHDYFDKLLAVHYPKLIDPHFSQLDLEFNFKILREHKIIDFEYGDIFYCSLNGIATLSLENKMLMISDKSRFNLVVDQLKLLKDGLYPICFATHACALEVIDGKFNFFDPNRDTIEAENSTNATGLLINLLKTALSIQDTNAKIIQFAPKEQLSEKRNSTMLYFDKEGHHELCLAAAELDDPAALNFLLEQDAINAFAQKSYKKDLLIRAIHRPGKTTFDLVINNEHVNINRSFQDKENITPLIFAIMGIPPERTLEIVKKLCAHRDKDGNLDLDPNLKTNENKTALYYAVGNQNIEVVDELLKLPTIQVNIVVKDNSSTISNAINQKNYLLVEKILKYANTHSQDFPTSHLLYVASQAISTNDQSVITSVLPLISVHVFKRTAHPVNLLQKALADNYPESLIKELLNDPISKLSTQNTDDFIKNMQYSLQGYPKSDVIKAMVADMIGTRIREDTGLSTQQKVEWLQALAKQDFFCKKDPASARKFTRTDTRAVRIFNKTMQQIDPSTHSHKRKQSPSTTTQATKKAKR